MKLDQRMLKKYEIAVYVILLLLAALLGFIGHHLTHDTIKSITLNLSSEFLAVALLFFFLNRFFMSADREDSAREQKIAVTLTCGGKRLELPVELRRSEFSRAELLGRIGMLPMKEKGKRFSLNYTNSTEFLRQLNQIADSDGDAAMTISCDEQEFNQFELKPARSR